MLVIALALVLCVCCWWVGDATFRTKALLTLLYVASFGLLLLPEQAYLFIVAQCVWAAVFGVAAFGVDFLNQRR